MLKSFKQKLSAVLIMVILLTISMTVTALAAESTFSDVSADAWYAEAVAYVQQQGLMNGNTTTEFAPEKSLTRAMLVTVLYRLEDEPTVSGDDGFDDTADGQWYSAAVLWAARQGVVNGYGEGLFGPDDNITQEQLNLIMSRYAGQNVTQNITGFTGSAEAATRAQVAAVLMNLGALTDDNTPTESNPTDNAENNEVDNDEPKILVAYFSATNNTENIANHIVTTLGADVYEITPETPYTSEDLNYGNNNSRTSIEMNDPDARPAISGGVADMDQYDIIFLGYPIWWGQAPKIISSFLEAYDFSGKTIVPFCTSGSSGIGSSSSNLQSLAEDANWLNGQRFSGNASQTDVAAWVNGLNLTAAR